MQKMRNGRPFDPKLPFFILFLIFDELVKSLRNDGFVKKLQVQGAQKLSSEARLQMDFLRDHHF